MATVGVAEGGFDRDRNGGGADVDDLH